jgi:hypothetical protein
MKEIDKGNSEKQIQERSPLGWWSRLTEYSLYLLKLNFIYLIFILPSFLCIFIFFMFNAHLFLILGIVLFIPSGPAILVMYEATDKVAAGEVYSNLPRFFSAFKGHLHTGIAFGAVLDIAFFVTLYPLYFALVVNGAMKVLIMICVMITLLIISILFPHITRSILSGQYKSLLKRAVISAVNSVKASFIAGILQLVWVFFCVLFPYIAFIAALIGVPAVIKMSTMYILSQIGDWAE